RTPTQAGEAEVEARVGLGLGSICQVGIEVEVLPAGVGEGRRVGATVDHRGLDGRLAREGGYRPLTEVAALKAIAEVRSCDHRAAAQADRVRAACRVVGDRHTGATRAGGRR